MDIRDEISRYLDIYTPGVGAGIAGTQRGPGRRARAHVVPTLRQGQHLRHRASRPPASGAAPCAHLGLGPLQGAVAREVGPAGLGAHLAREAGAQLRQRHGLHPVPQHQRGVEADQRDVAALQQLVIISDK